MLCGRWKGFLEDGTAAFLKGRERGLRGHTEKSGKFRTESVSFLSLQLQLDVRVVRRRRIRELSC